MKVDRIVGKLVTMLGWPDEYFKKKRTEVSEDLARDILKMEMALCEETEALVLAGHLQAIAYKR